RPIDHGGASFPKPILPVLRGSATDAAGRGGRMSRATFTDRIQSADVAKMPDEYQDLLVRLLTIQADCEIGGPHVYGPRWFLNAPTAEDVSRVTHVLAEE